MTATLTVTVNDDEEAKLVVSGTALDVAEGSATGTSYTVRLSHVPTVTVTVTVSGHDNSDLTLSGLSATDTLTFTSSNWATEQTVTVKAGEDADAVNDEETLTHTGAGGAFEGLTEEVAVVVDDDEETDVVLSAESLDLVEGAAGLTYTVKLSSEPTATTTVAIEVPSGASLSLSTTTLTFTKSDWDTEQTVRVTATQDDDAVNEEETLTHTASGGDYRDVKADLTVAIDDDDETGVVLSRTSLELDEGGAGQTYTVKLSSEPTATTTVEITGHEDTDLSPSTTTLEFTKSAWDTEQTVTVTAGEDADAADDEETLTHTASGGDYGGVTAELTVRVDDDETATLVVVPTDIGVAEGSATGTGYTVKLSHVPTEPVTVTVSGHDNTDLTLQGLTGDTLTFTTSNWDTEQTVTVTASHDDDAVNDKVTLTHTGGGGAYGEVSKEVVTVTVDDDEETRVVLSAESLDLVEGAAGLTYTLKLSSEPTATTTVEITVPSGASLSLSTTTLTFTTSNWNSGQTVRVTATQDDDAVNEEETLTHTANGGDYREVTADLTVRVDDDDEARVVLSLTSVELVEGGAGQTYTVKLSSEPTATTTVEIEVPSGTDLTLSGPGGASTLTFTKSNWNVAQTVTVTAGPDPDAADDEETLTHTASGGDYGNVTATLKVTVDDDETASLVVVPTDIGVDEGSATGTGYTVKLSHVPTEPVTVTVRGHAGTDLSLSTTTLTFTSSNWNAPQTVTVTASHDDDAVNDKVALKHTGAGGAYEGLTVRVDVTVDDDEETRVVLSLTSVEIDEGNTAGAIYTVKLSSEPTSTTTVAIAVPSGASLSLDKTTLTFASSNWNTEQTVKVTATDDADAADEEETLTHTASGGDYGGVRADLSVIIDDDETASLVVVPTDIGVAEGSATGTGYTVKLSHVPTVTVTVEVAGHDDSDLTLSGLSATGTLTFTPTNWDTEQTVTVKAGADADAVNDEEKLTHTAEGGEYGEVSKVVTVTVDDDEETNVVLSAESLDLVEGAAGLTYAVSLSSEPTATTTVAIAVPAGASLSLDKTTLTFTKSDWNTEQTVRVTATQDDDAVNEDETLTHTANGGDYRDVKADLTVRVDDDEETRVVLSRTSVEIDEGNTAGATYTVKLSSEPTATTTVEITGHEDTDLSPSTTTLEFTTSNWNSAQTVKVTATQDADAANEEETLTHTASGGDYGDVTATLTVKVDDDEEAKLVVSGTALGVAEGSATGTGYTVRLSHVPTVTVTVTVSGHDNTDLTLQGLTGDTLTFTTSNWDTEQTVTVKAGEDADAVNDEEKLTHTAGGGEYGEVSKEVVTVTVDDDEETNVVLSAESLDLVEGAAGLTYTVRLSSEPTDTTTVEIGVPAGASLSLDKTTLTFASSNWNTDQTVRVTATQDADAVNEDETLTHTANGGDYRDVKAALTVMVDDDDEARVVLSATSLNPVEGDTSGVTYTVSLSSEPTATTTVEIAGHEDTDLSPSTTTLTFTKSNWNSAQTVKVTATDDADAADEEETLTHTASGGDYRDVTATLKVRVDDDEEAKLVVVPTDIEVDENATGTGYTVKLSHVPTVTVTVTVRGHAGTDLTLTGLSDTGTLTFTTSNWDTEQTVTVKASHDADAADDEETLMHEGAGGAYEGLTKDVDVTVDDDETAMVVLSLTSVEINEGDTTGASYTVKLSSEPTATTTVEVRGHAGTDLRLSGLSATDTLTFTSSNWDTPQEVTVTVIRDADAVVDSATLTHTASGGDYAGLKADLSVLVTENDTPGLVLSETDLTVHEEGATSVSYTVTLATEPAAAVTVTVTGHDGTDLTMSGLSDTNTLEFSTTNWNIPQTVMVTATGDADAAGEEETLTHTASGGDYGNVTATLTVKVNDDETASLVVVPTDIEVDENATGTSYTVKLSHVPIATTTVEVRGHAGTDLRLAGLSDTGTLTFTTSNWDTEQTVTVTASQDADAVDDKVTLTHTGREGEYEGLTKDLPVIVDDDETAMVLLSPESLDLVEGAAGGGTYTVRLSSEPTSTTTVEIEGHTGTDLSLDVTTFTFTASNWDTGQTVTVTAGHDDDAEDDEETLTHTAAGGEEYRGLTKALRVTVSDDEEFGVTVTPAAIAVVAGGGNEYTVRLDSQPAGDVTVTVSGHAGSALTLSGPTNGRLTFTRSNWDTAQTVSVSAGASASAANVTLTHTAGGTADSSYDGLTGELRVIVVARSASALTVQLGVTTLNQSLTVDEGGTGTYAIVLSHVPSGDVTVTITDPTDNTDVTADPGSLLFSTSTWSTPQNVTVTAAEDDDSTTDAVATVTHTVSGGGYDDVTAPSAEVTIRENDTPGLVLDKSSVAIEEDNATGTSYTVRLATRPTATTTVEVSGHAGTDLTLTGLSASSTLEFTSSNWNVGQTVTVTAGDDDDAVDERETLTHTANGGDYQDVTAALTVDVDDDDETGVALSPESLDLVEGAAGLTYTVSLSSEPTATTTVAIEVPSGASLSLNKTTLTFTSSNWNSGQTVRVTATQDADAANEEETLTHTASGGDYGDVTATLTVKVDDDEEAELVVSATEIDVAEGSAMGTGYTVKLSHVPTVTVTVTVSGHDNSDLTLQGLTGDTLTFTTSNWNTPQTVTVKAGADDDAVNDEETLTHTGGGGEYEGLTREVAVTVDDDEETGVELSRSSVELEEGNTATYTVSLSSEPTATTTVEIEVPSGASLSLSTTTLTFTKSDWSTGQTVMVTATQDADAVNEDETLTHTANGEDYREVKADLTVTVDDDDETGVELSRTSVEIDEGDTTGATYTVKLSSEPTATATVAITVPEDADLSLSTTTLTFTKSNWSTEQTVKVTATQDADAANEEETLTHTASGGDYGNVTATLTVNVNDDETASLVVVPTEIDVAEGSGTGTGYTVSLSHLPTEPVTVTVRGHSGTDLSLTGLSATGTLTFTTSNWNTAQAVTVKAGADADAVNDEETLTHTGAGGEYEGLTKDVDVTVDDDEEAMVVLSKSSVEIDEGDTTGASYTVKLSSEPTATTTVEVNGHAGTDLRLSGLSATGTLTFTTSNWSTEQTVRVKAGHDEDALDDEETLTHTARGGDYQDVTAALTVTVEDDESPHLVISPTAISVDEGAAAGARYTVKLGSQPTATTTVTVRGHGGTDLTLTGLSDTNTLTFTAANWNTAQNVTVKASHDDDAADDKATLTHTAGGGDYGGVDKDLPVTVDDDETASLVVDPTDIDVAEGSATGTTYTVELSHVPTATTTVEITGHAGTDLSLDGTTFTFTASNWDTGQTVTVTAGHDEDALDDEETLTHTAAGGVEYEGLTKALRVTVTDDEEFGVTVAPAAIAVVAGGSNEYTVRLDSQPAGDVTVTVSGHTGSALTLSGPTNSRLTFTRSNWDTPQTVSVSAGASAAAADVTLTHTAGSTADSSYEGLTGELRVIVVAKSASALTVQLGVTTLNQSLTVDEGGTGTYAIVLSHVPSGDVTVTITDPTDNTDVTADPGSLLFSTSTWSTPQNVTVTAAEDDDATTDAVATVRHTVSGGGYDAVTAPSAEVTIRENDSPGLVLDKSSVAMAEGNATGTSYTVRLATRPTATTTVEVSGHAGTDLTLAGLSASSTLEFTSSNWNVGQTVTVTAGEDADAVNDRETLTHAASGGDYEGSAPMTLTVKVTDNDQAGLVLSKTSISPEEGSSTGESYTVGLATQPSQPVTVAIAGHSSGTDLSLDKSSLVFTSANWNVGQTVTVTAAEDEDAVDDRETLTHTASGGEYDDVEVSLSVTVTDTSDMTVSFDSATYSATEGGPNATVTVQLNAPAPGQLVIPITAAPVGTTDASDWQGVPEEVTFQTGETSRTFMVVAFDDEAEDDGEMVEISLGDLPEGWVAGSHATAKITLMNDDTSLGTFSLDCDQAAWCADLELADYTAVDWVWLWLLYKEVWDPPSALSNPSFTFRGKEYTLRDIHVSAGMFPGVDNLWGRSRHHQASLAVTITGGEAWNAPPVEHYRDWVLHIDGLVLPFSQATRLGGFSWTGPAIQQFYLDWTASSTTRIGIAEIPLSDQPAAPIPVPHFVSVTPAGATALSVEWKAPRDAPGAASITGYEVQWKVATAGWADADAVSQTRVAADRTMYFVSLSGLTENELYTVRVVATGASDQSLPSPEVLARPQTYSPRMLSAVVNGRKLTMRFDRELATSSVPDAGSFTVLADGGLLEVDMVSIVSSGEPGMQNDAVELTLERPVSALHTVLSRYDAPADPAETFLSDVQGRYVPSPNDTYTLHETTNETDPATVEPLTARFTNVPSSHDGQSSVSLNIEFSESAWVGVGLPMYELLKVTGGTLASVHWLDRRTEQWKVTIQPHGDEDIVVVMPANRSCSDNQTEVGAPCAAGNRELTNRPEVTIPRYLSAGQSDATENTPAEGRPTITGTPVVGGTLNADTSGISDADGMDDAGFSYQWLADDVILAQATGSSYSVTEADVGRYHRRESELHRRRGQRGGGHKRVHGAGSVIGPAAAVGDRERRDALPDLQRNPR